MPLENVLLQYRDGKDEKIQCEKVSVPIDERGQPVVVRVTPDKFNNLRIIESSRAFRIINCEMWTQIRVEEPAETLKIVKNDKR